MENKIFNGNQKQYMKTVILKPGDTKTKPSFCLYSYIYGSGVLKSLWKCQKSKVWLLADRYWCPNYFLTPSEQKVRAVWNLVVEKVRISLQIPLWGHKGPLWPHNCRRLRISSKIYTKIWKIKLSENCFSGRKWFQVANLANNDHFWQKIDLSDPKSPFWNFRCISIVFPK